MVAIRKMNALPAEPSTRRMRGAGVMLGALLPLAAGLTGCSSNMKREWNTQRALHAQLDPNIVKLYSYYSNNPFMSFDPEGDQNPEGIKVSAFYAFSSSTQQGAFADGTIRFKMFVVHRPPGETPFGELVKIWEFDPEQAKGWRVKRPTHLGWPYQFYLNWGDAEVYGREIRVVPEFVRTDGTVVRGSPRSFKVPSRKESVRLIESH